jgi:hypothetical protein
MQLGTSEFDIIRVLNFDFLISSRYSSQVLTRLAVVLRTIGR